MVTKIREICMLLPIG